MSNGDVNWLDQAKAVAKARLAVERYELVPNVAIAQNIQSGFSRTKAKTDPSNAGPGLTASPFILTGKGEEMAIKLGYAKSQHEEREQHEETTREMTADRFGWLYEMLKAVAIVLAVVALLAGGKALILWSRTW